MSYTPDQIIAVICPGLASDPGLQMYIDMAADVTDQGFYGVTWSKAVALRASHEWTLDHTRSQGESGAVSQKSEGQLSLSYAVGDDQDDLSQTQYGRRLLALRHSQIAGVGVINGSGSLGEVLNDL
jgi:hypothetical protein